jgi:hypothetical protein
MTADYIRTTNDITGIKVAHCEYDKEGCYIYVLPREDGRY